MRSLSFLSWGLFPVLAVATVGWAEHRDGVSKGLSPHDLKGALG